MKKWLMILFLPLALMGCATPDKPLSLDEEKQWQIQQSIITARNVVFVAEAYVAVEGKDWPEDKLKDYKKLIAIAKTSIDGVERLLQENDLLSAESQAIMMEVFIEALKEANKEDL